MSWRVIPEAQKAAFVNWPKEHSNWQKLRRYLSWRMWDGNRYGLEYYDQAFEVKIEVKEALRRLNIKEPWIYDERQERILKHHQLAMRNEFLPKSKWTKWEEETFYLFPYLAEIQQEMFARSKFTDLMPIWKEMVKMERENHYFVKKEDR